jgi:HEAT repeats
VRAVRGGRRRPRSRRPTRSSVTRADGLPARFTQRWIEETMPILDQRQVDHVIAVMRQRGWTDEELRRRVLPYVRVRPVGEHRQPSSADQIQVGPTPQEAQVGHSDSYSHAMAVLNLRDHLDESMIPMLRSLLDDPDPMVRRKAADYLAEIQTRRA